MKYSQFLQKMPHQAITLMEEVGRHNCMAFDRNGTKMGIHLDMPGRTKYELSDLAFRYMLTVRDEMPFVQVVESVIITNVLGKGPKIFRPTVEQCRMMEEVDLTLTVEDYHQPFESILLEIPEEYKQDKKLKDGCTPHILGIHYNEAKKIFVFFIVCSDLVSHKSWWLPAPEDELETYFTVDIEKWMNYAQENQNYLDLIRVALNYALLLDEYGVKRIGPDNPEYYERLARNAKKKTHHQARNLAELATLPMVYSIDQTPVLRRIVTSQSDTDGHTGRAVTPHHRRGHYRQQPYGPGGKLRKRRRIPPCFVNSHLYLGTMDKSITTYETR